MDRLADAGQPGAERATLTVAELLEAARGGLPRLSPEESHEAALAGAALVDIRSETSAMARTARSPLATWIPRNVLEWRLDPACPTGTRARAPRPSSCRAVRRGLSVEPRRGEPPTASAWMRPTSSAASRPGGRPACRSRASRRSGPPRDPEDVVNARLRSGAARNPNCSQRSIVNRRRRSRRPCRVRGGSRRYRGPDPAAVGQPAGASASVGSAGITCS